MNEHPILFSTEMVNAILEGRKTQTRRVIKPQPGYQGVEKMVYMLHPFAPSCLKGTPGENVICGYPEEKVWCHEDWAGNIVGVQGKCRYGVPEDLLWVKETFGVTDSNQAWDIPKETLLNPYEETAFYKADMPPKSWSSFKWKPSIFMPRKFARIWLRVLDVRVERVQDISNVDAIDEGVVGLSEEWIFENFPEYANDYREWDRSSRTAPPLGPSPKMKFEKLWDEINSKRGFGWDANPWVWVVEFERTEKP